MLKVESRRMKKWNIVLSRKAKRKPERTRPSEQKTSPRILLHRRSRWINKAMRCSKIEEQLFLHSYVRKLQDIFRSLHTIHDNNRRYVPGHVGVAS